MGQFLDALRYAHGRLVHRDPSPPTSCSRGGHEDGRLQPCGRGWFEWMATQVEATVAAMATGGEATLKMSDQ